jgi:hypothetical protein
MDNSSKFQGKKGKTFDLTRRINQLFEFLLELDQIVWGFHSASAMPIPISILPVYCHTFHIRIYDIAAFQSSGRRAP